MNDPRILAQREKLWPNLVKEASKRNDILFDEEIERYLVEALMRHATNTDLVSARAAIKYLRAWEQHGVDRMVYLRETGDLCVLTVGIWPMLARERLVTPNYYVAMAQSAYSSAAESAPLGELKRTYKKLSKNVLDMVITLSTIKSLSDIPIKEIDKRLLDAYREYLSSITLVLQ